jgi:hypothetical protein
MSNLKIEVVELTELNTASGAILAMIKNEVNRIPSDFNVESLCIKIKKLEEILDGVDESIKNIKKIIG